MYASHRESDDHARCSRKGLPEIDEPSAVVSPMAAGGVGVGSALVSEEAATPSLTWATRSWSIPESPSRLTHREEGPVRRQLRGDRLTRRRRGIAGGLGSLTMSPVEPSTTVSDCSFPAGVAGWNATIMSGSGGAAS